MAVDSVPVLFRLAFDAADAASREQMKQTWQAANLGELPAFRDNCFHPFLGGY